MRTLRRFFKRLSSCATRERDERRLRDEIEEHLALQTADNVRAGMQPLEARRQAVLKFGHVEAMKEHYRDLRSLPFFETLMQDVRYGIRILCSSPVFTVVAVLSLALGIGANTAMFSIVDAVLLRPLPYTDPDRLVVIWEQDEQGNRDNATYSTWHDWRAQSTSFDDMALMGSWLPTLTGSGEPESISGLRVTSNFFRTLGVRPMLGRDFRPEEDTPNTSNVVILSYELWKRRFGADPDISGKTISLNQSSYIVAGVLPPQFPSLLRQAEALGAPEIYRVLGYDVSLPWACRTCHHLVAIGRLKASVTRPQAEAEMGAIQDGLMRRYPKEYASGGITIQPLADHIVGKVAPTLRLLLAAVGFVLLLACVNLANLMLARSATREREMAIRVALGAGRGRVIRQLLTENCLLGVLAAGLALLLAFWAPAISHAMSGVELPRLSEVHLDTRAVLFCAVLGLITGIASGLGPAVHLARKHPDAALKDGSRSSVAGVRRPTGLLVALEMCFSLTLLVCAGLMLRSLVAVLAVDPGFNPQHVLTMQVTTVGPTYKEDEPVRQFYRQVIGRIRALPGVVDAAGVSQIPLGGNMDRYGFHAVGKMNVANPELDPSADRYAVTPDYLRTMGIRLLRGRDFSSSDAQGTQRVVIVNREAVRRIWPNEDPLGKQVKLGGSDEPPWTVVGIVSDVHHEGLDQVPAMQSYVPHAQWQHADDLIIVVRTSGEASHLAKSVQQAIHSVDAKQPISHVATLEDLVRASVVGRRTVLFLLGGFALLALLLASIGVYGVTAYGVAQRTYEIGIRLAIGATPPGVLRMVLSEGLRLTIAGIALGIILALFATRLIATMLFGIKSTDPLTLGSVIAVLLAVAMGACWIPARRASRVEPQSALRQN